jgi:hypothetical protein
MQPMQSEHITTNVVSSNMYSIQHYVMKFVSNLRQVGGFLRVLRFPPPFGNIYIYNRFMTRFGSVWFIVFNDIFNNIPVISWRSDLMVEETGVPLFGKPR